MAVALSLVGWDAQGLVLAVVRLAPSELDRAVLPSPRNAILARGTVAGIVSNAILTDSSILAGTLLTLIDVNSTFHTCERDSETGSHCGISLRDWDSLPEPARHSPTQLSPGSSCQQRAKHSLQSVLLPMQEQENQTSVSSQVLFIELWPVSPHPPNNCCPVPSSDPTGSQHTEGMEGAKQLGQGIYAFFLNRFAMLKG